MLHVHVALLYIVTIAYYTNSETFVVTLVSGSDGDPGTRQWLKVDLCDYTGTCITSGRKFDKLTKFVGRHTFSMDGVLKTLDHGKVTGDVSDGYDLAKFMIERGGRSYVNDTLLEVYHKARVVNLRKCHKRINEMYAYYHATQNCTACNCDMNAKCDPFSGECVTCAAGFKGTECNVPCNDGNHGLRCTGVCSPNCRNICAKSNGYCKCKPGYYGSSCGNPCQPNRYGINCDRVCDNCQDGCNSTNGICIGACIPGYIGDKCDQCKGHRYGDSCLPCDNGTFGETCENNCSKYCVNMCDKRNGSCSCLPGYTTSTCSRQCSFGRSGFNCQDTCETCAKGCNHVNGTCIGGCIIGYVGPKCKPCNGSYYGIDCLKDCNCFKNYACNYTTGNCGRHGCGAGWTGDLTCSVKIPCGNHEWGQTCINCGGCRVNCKVNKQTCYQRCDRKTGVCAGKVGQCMANFVGPRCDVCKKSMYGRKCDQHCAKCHTSCNTVTGLCHHYECEPGYVGPKCDIPCKVGFYGIFCSEKINICGDQRCEDSEFCDDDHYFGLDCKLPCLKCEGGICTKKGICTKGCIPGYVGETCQKACISGRYGRNCEKLCGGCADWAECDKRTGDCPDGCLGYFVIPQCTVCPVGYFGPECDSRCGHCKNEEPCDHHSGVCWNGCAVGFKGHYCAIRLHDIPEELDISLDL